jgi:hypothetical protein
VISLKDLELIKLNKSASAGNLKKLNKKHEDGK